MWRSSLDVAKRAFPPERPSAAFWHWTKPLTNRWRFSWRGAASPRGELIVSDGRAAVRIKERVAGDLDGPSELPAPSATEVEATFEV